MINKVFNSFDDAVADIPDGASILMMCWGVSATPQNLIAATKRKGIKDLTIITHNFVPLPLGTEDEVTMPPVLLPQMKKLISAIVGFQQLGAGAFVKEYVERGLEVELTTHGTMASRLYAGAACLGGFYDPIGIGTILAKGKEIRIINDREYIFQEPIRADYAFIRGYKADKLGNLVYQGTYRSGQPVMAMAADVTIAEVDEIVEVGEIDAEHVVTPGAFVDRIVEIPPDGLGTQQSKKMLISRLGGIDMARKMMFRPVDIDQSPDESPATGVKQRLDRETIAMRAARELKDGDCVNLGLGIPNLCSLYIPDGVIFQSENGVLGYGPLVMEDRIEEAEFHYVDAGGRFWTPAPGMSLFDLITSFAMIRSGRLITILGALQVSEKGDLANWNKGDDPLGGTIGGGMDLAVGARKVIVTMEHTSKDGKPKIVKECTCPLTARECIDLIVSDLAVIEVSPEGLLLKEVAPGWTPEEVQALTEPELIISPDLKEIEL
ncbi:MAG: 3-oxoacid CoA-transferase subunit A [Dehalococcoidia bacterium]|nr:MAG: 3-oxoacid CoA-transferase subunit A [Dehalococcoidia bacterium]